MAHMPGADPWVITSDDRSKHEVQFFHLKPVNGFLSGEKARDFFLKSSLPTPVLGKIWSLADLNADGQMDQREFSIGVHLIKKKLQGIELPATLPPSLLAEPINTRVQSHMTSGSGMALSGSAMPVGGMVQSGMVPAQSMWSASSSTVAPVPSLSQHSMPGSPASFGVTMSTPVLAYPSTPTKISAPAGVSSGSDWAIPQAQKLKYNQLFNTQDRLRRGYLTGVEARSILMQSGLTHAVLAQIWNLADVDNDGKLTSEEFVLAMYLVDLATSHTQPLPSKLPPDLIPPSYRRSRSGSGLITQPLSGVVTPLPTPPPGVPPAKTDTFVDLLSGFMTGANQPQVVAPLVPPEPEPTMPELVTFEDRRKENFDKGQAELEKRRARLREQQQAETEARLAAEKAEQEKRERIRQEQEEKRQADLERQMERQRQIEQQRDDQRRKALEQRDAARRELEQHRQLEWERQRREQLIAEKHRERATVDQIQAEVAMLKLQLDALDSKKIDLGGKTDQSRTSVSDVTLAIDSMRHTRDSKLSDIERFDVELQDWSQKLGTLTQEKQQLAAEVQAQNAAIDDTFRTVQHSYQSKQATITRLHTKLQQIEADTSAKLEQIDSGNVELTELKKRLSQLQQARDIARAKESAANVNSTAVMAGAAGPNTRWSHMACINNALDKSDHPYASAWANPFKIPSPVANSVKQADQKTSRLWNDKLDSSTVAQTARQRPSPSRTPMLPKQPPNSWTLSARSKPHTSVKTQASTLPRQTRCHTISASRFTRPTTITYYVASPRLARNCPLPPSPIRRASPTVITPKPSAMKPTQGIRQAGPMKTSTPIKPALSRHGPTHPQSPIWAGMFATMAAAARKARYVSWEDSFGQEKYASNGFATSQSTSWANSFFDSNRKEKEAITVPPMVSEKRSVDIKSADITMDVDDTIYQALYQFEARSTDELSFVAGDIIWVKADQSDAEQGWLGGRKEDGTSGWFPAAYAAPVLQAEAATYRQQQSQQSEQATVADEAAVPQQNSLFGNSLRTSEVDTAQNSTVLTSSRQSSFTAVQASSLEMLPDSETPVSGRLQARALYPWKAKKDNHMTFNKDDIITVTEQQDMWWCGQLGSESGWFPKSYVKLLDSGVADTDVTSPTSPYVSNDNSTSEVVSGGETAQDKPNASAEPEYYVAMYTYSSCEPGDLTFTQGEIMTVSVKDGDWWTGSIGDRRTGIFPANYVKQVEAQDITGSKETGAPPAGGHQQLEVMAAGNAGRETAATVANDCNSLSRSSQFRSSRQVGQKSSKKPEIASVLAPYQATGPEQLSLKVGQLIQVRKKSPSGWWEGELQARGKKRQIGWFPANYVKILGGSSARSTPDSQAQRGASSLSVSSYSSATSPLPDGGSRSATPISYPAPTMAPSVEQVLALYSYTAQKDDELSFVKDSVVNVLSKPDADWWQCELNGASGLVPSNYVAALSAAVEDGSVGTTEAATVSSWTGEEEEAISEAVTMAMVNKREKHIQELINTEETYLQDLSIVFDVFCKPLKEANVLTDEQVQTVFVNLNEIIMCNMKLVKAMRVRKKLTGKGQAIQIIGDILCENLPHMSPYIRFCSCQLNAGTLIQHLNDTSSKFKEVSKKSVADPRAKGLPISSYLLKPMQRITKYPLLIEKILQYTEETHPDRQNLVEAHANSQEICNQVNEGVKERDNSDKLEWIQNHVQCDGLPEKLTFNSVTNCLGPRKFITSGTLYKSKSNKELVGFLFNDFILLTQPQHSLGSMASVFSFDIKANTQFKLYRDPIFLNEIAVRKPAEADVENNLFHLSHIGRMYSFKAVSTMERDSWVKKIDEASQSYMATEKRKLEKAYAARKMSPRGFGRLLVTIIEGIDLIAANSNARKVPAMGRLLVVVQEGCNLQLGEQGKSDPYCEVSMGMQEHKTRVLNNTLNPKWNSSMQFTIKDLHEDVLCITVYDRDLFTPNDFLGRTEIRIKDISVETREVMGPIVKTLLLHEVDSGEVVIKLDLQLYDKT